MSTTTPTGRTVVDEGRDFMRFQLPAWISPDDAAELQRLAAVHIAGLLAAHRVASAVRAKLSTGDARPGGIDEVADALGIEVEHLRVLLTGAAPGFTVQQLATIAAMVGCSVSEILAAADEAQVDYCPGCAHRLHAYDECGACGCDDRLSGPQA